MKTVKMIAVLLAVLIFVMLGCAVTGLAAGPGSSDEPADAAKAADAAAMADKLPSVKAIAAGGAVALVATAGAIGMAMVICRTTDNMARQPEASSQINGAMMLGLVFIETVILYALIVAILIIFVL